MNFHIDSVVKHPRYVWVGGIRYQQSSSGKSLRRLSTSGGAKRRRTLSRSEYITSIMHNILKKKLFGDYSAGSLVVFRYL